MTTRWIHLFACVAAMTLPFWAPTPSVSKGDEGFPGWPSRFENEALKVSPRSELERKFESGFPGRIGVFHQGRRSIVLHWISEPTRAFHFSGQCLEGKGWKLTSAPRQIHEGVMWVVFEAKRGDERAQLRQRIVDDEGQFWFDESSWYWAALGGKTKGPWTAWTVVEPMPLAAADSERRRK